MNLSAQKKHALSSALALALLAPLQAAAATDYFLEIDGVKGEVNGKGVGGSIELLSWSWGGSSSSGKVVCAQDLTVMKSADSTSDDLANALNTGKSFGEATLLMRRSGDSSVINHTIVFRDVKVTSYQSSASSGGEAPSESLSFSYLEAEGNYSPVDPATGALGSPQQYFIVPGKCD